MGYFLGFEIVYSKLLSEVNGNCDINIGVLKKRLKLCLEVVFIVGFWC